ncbi:MAG: sel1 repeat family protein [Leptolyngbyaceae cyanobacterium CAN_BIN12]|nr:sel1 repeat family protein [Leptolyngbyaceae cyanobacterium CAN_BIN12]
MTDLDAGIAAFYAQNYTTTFHLLSPLAEQGNDEAQCMLGCLYQLGLGIEFDQALAAFLYRLGADQRLIKRMGLQPTI